jgi:hypothetical protein
VNNGNSGDIWQSVLEFDPRWRLNHVILWRWETIASVRAPVRDCPDMQRLPIRIRLGDRPPAQSS